MPKYIGRIQFETMKVLRKRGGSIKNIAEAVGLSKGAVSRNLKYKTYEEYLAAMYSHKSKFQKEVEAKSGPVRVVTPAAKACSCCGKVKNISEFTADKNAPDGHKGQCRKCINAKVRARRHAQKAVTIAEVPHVEMAKEEPRKEESPDLAALKLIAEELKKMSAPEKVEEEQPKDEAVENESEELEEDKNIPVGERVWVKVDKGIKRGVVVSVNDLDYTVRYLVRLNGLFGKYITTTEDKMFR